MAFEIPTRTAPPNPFAPPLSMSGSTGGPGNTLPSDPSLFGEEKSQNVHLDVSFHEKDQLNYDPEVLEVMIGGSGGIGGIPTSVGEAQDREMTPVKYLKLLNDSVSKMDTDKMSETLLNVYRRSQPIIAKANMYGAITGLQIGVIANLVKKGVIKQNYSKKAWTQYRREKFDKYIHPNTLAVYMKIAAIDNVASYLHLGIDRLGKLASVIEKQEMINDKDPILNIIKSIDDETIASGVDYDFSDKCEAAILHYRVKKAGLDSLTMNDILSMLNEGNSLDKNDIDKMVKMKNSGEDYRAYIDKANEHNTAVDDKDDAENDARKEKKVKDINAEIQKLKETILEVMRKDKVNINLNLDRLDSLIHALTMLRQNHENECTTLDL